MFAARARGERRGGWSRCRRARWLATVRDAVVRNNGPYDAGPGIDAPSDAPATVTVGDAAESRLPGRARAALTGEAAAAAYVRRLRDDLVPRADQNHQYKLRRRRDRGVAPRRPAPARAVLSTALDYVPAASEPPTDVHRRSRSALERAGVLRRS